MQVLQHIILLIGILVLVVVATQVLISITGVVFKLVTHVAVPVIMLPVKLLSATCHVIGWSVAAPMRLAGIGGGEMPSEPVVLGTPCPEGRCRCGNPASARFCRRCGRNLPSPLA